MGIPNTPDPLTLACPRCGYDLTPMVPPPGPARDAVAVCSECGLAFNWAGLIEARKQLVPHFVEHAKGLRATIVSIPRTFSWLVLPHRFWRRVRIEHPIRLSRAGLWLIVAVLAPRLIEACVLLVTMALGIAANLRPPPSDMGDVLRMLAVALNVRGHGWVKAPPLVTIATLLPLFSATMLLVLPQTRERAKVRLTHVVRCWIYAHTLAALILIANCASTIYAVCFETRIPAPWARGVGLPYEILEYMRSTAHGRTQAFPILLLIMLAWQAWYWFSALKIGLRVDRSTAVTAAITTASTLATFTVLLMLEALPIDVLAW